MLRRRGSDLLAIGTVESTKAKNPRTRAITGTSVRAMISRLLVVGTRSLRGMEKRMIDRTPSHSAWLR